jgi:archaellum component FlaC
MGWDEAEVKRQLRRVNTIMRLQAIAGRPEDREAALIECQTSVDLLAKQGPKIEEKIEKLRAELSGLERDASTSQKRVEAQSEAVQQLRNHCPQDIKERVQQAVQIVEAGIGQDLRTATARHRELQSVLNLGNIYQSPQKHLDALKFLSRAAVLEGASGGFITRAYSPEWPAIKAGSEIEYADLSGRLPELQAEYDEAIRQAELPLSYYADPKNQEQD